MGRPSGETFRATGPVNFAAHRSTMPAWAAWLTTAGYWLTISASAVQPCALQTPFTTSWNLLLIVAKTASSTSRMVPPNVAVSGMTLSLSPAWNWATVTTALAQLGSARDTMVCSELTSAAPHTMGSMQACGWEPCPPRPAMTMRKVHVCAITAPVFTAKLPRFQVGQLCQPYTSSTPSKQPSSIMGTAPPPPVRLKSKPAVPGGVDSSAGWKSNRTVQFEGIRSARRCKRIATPTREVMWPSCPHMWAMPSFLDRYGNFELPSVIVSASKSLRNATHVTGASALAGPVPRMSATSPVIAVDRIWPSGMPANLTRTSRTRAEVRTSLKPGSGCMCTSRRKPINEHQYVLSSISVGSSAVAMGAASPRAPRPRRCRGGLLPVLGPAS
mmetsp:Transcript_62070/g.189557  ORF Transcript_62070/g.189557 Transcript_62070/m.189557 type:complete len:386 (+) Transcript_62070:500-1657(+)